MISDLRTIEREKQVTSFLFFDLILVVLCFVALLFYFILFIHSFFFSLVLVGRRCIAIPYWAESCSDGEEIFFQRHH